MYLQPMNVLYLWMGCFQSKFLRRIKGFQDSKCHFWVARLLSDVKFPSQHSNPIDESNLQQHFPDTKELRYRYLYCLLLPSCPSLKREDNILGSLGVVKLSGYEVYIILHKYSSNIKNRTSWQFCWWPFWDGENVTRNQWLSQSLSDLQRSGIKRSQLGSPGF